MAEPKQLIISIAIIVSIHLHRKFLKSTDEVKAYHCQIETLFGKAKESARTCFDGINNTNWGAFVLETVQAL